MNGQRQWTAWVGIVTLTVWFTLTSRARAQSVEPFSLEFKAPPSPSETTKAIAKHIDLQAKLIPERAGRGEVVRLVITGKPKQGFHTYPITRKVERQEQLSSLRIEADHGLAPLWPVRESTPQFLRNILGEIDLEHEKPFTWERDILILPDAVPGRKTLDILVRLQICNETSCLGPDQYLPLRVSVDVSDAARPLTAELAQRMKAKQPPVEIVAIPASVPPRSQPAPQPAKADDAPPGSIISANSSLLGLLGAAFGGAFLMLLTPCVFPMIPITVNFFLKQSEKEHHRPLAMASVYSGTIVVLLTVIMLVLGKVVVDLATDAWFNLALGAVLIVFALSLFGMFEIELPSFLARFTSSREGRGGYAGAIFMALTFTITSFTCTGPFLGAMMAPVAGLRPPLLHLVLAALVYSATFAGPFFVLALFPTLMKKLPKSGSWMNSVKVTMGFLEIGAALKFLSNADIAWFPADPRLFNYDTVLCAWIALSVACGLYLFGIFRLPHDDKVESIGVMRMMFASFFIGLAVYMAPALWGIKPQGIVGENLVAFLPLKSVAENSNREVAGGHLAWHLEYQDAWKEAASQKKLIFIDFTGVQCPVCRHNEQNVFPDPAVQGLLRRYARVQLYTDSVPDRKLSAAESKKQAELHAHWRWSLTKGIANPTYVLFRPDADATMTQGELKGQVIAFYSGLIVSNADFQRFLEAPLHGQVAQARDPAIAASRAN